MSGILLDGVIFIHAKHLHESLVQLNGDNTEVYDSMVVNGNFLLTSIDFWIILNKIAELNVTKLVMTGINFGLLERNSNKVEALETANRYPRKSKLRRIILEDCMYVQDLLSLLIYSEQEHPSPSNDSSHDDSCSDDFNLIRVKSLTDLVIINRSAYGKTIEVLAELIENNYTLRYVPVASGFHYLDISEIQKGREQKLKVEAYVERNKKAYNKYYFAITTLLGIRRYRRSILSLLPKDIFLIIVGLISETSGTKVWIDKAPTE